MTKQHELRDRSVAFVECGSGPCAWHMTLPKHMHCPCGCNHVTTVDPPIAWTCENCRQSCFHMSYDREMSLQLCQKCTDVARAARIDRNKKNKYDA